MNKRKKKETIPKPLKNKVWDYYNGRENGIGNCYCCKRIIDSKDFECGHVKAEAKGGVLILSNLRPICGQCNRSMGTTHMHDFMKKIGFYTYYPYLPNTVTILYIILGCMMGLDFYLNELFLVKHLVNSFISASQKAIYN
jgi:hypothetical protein